MQGVTDLIRDILNKGFITAGAITVTAAFVLYNTKPSQEKFNQAVLNQISPTTNPLINRGLSAIGITDYVYTINYNDWVFFKTATIEFASHKDVSFVFCGIANYWIPLSPNAQSIFPSKKNMSGDGEKEN